MRFLEVVGVLVLVCVCLSDAVANSGPGKEFRRETRHRTRTFDSSGYGPNYNGELMTVDMFLWDIKNEVQHMRDEIYWLSDRVAYLESTSMTAYGGNPSYMGPGMADPSYMGPGMADGSNMGPSMADGSYMDPGMGAVGLTDPGMGAAGYIDPATGELQTSFDPSGSSGSTGSHSHDYGASKRSNNVLREKEIRKHKGRTVGVPFGKTETNPEEPQTDKSVN